MLLDSRSRQAAAPNHPVVQAARASIRLPLTHMRAAGFELTIPLSQDNGQPAMPVPDQPVNFPMAGVVEVVEVPAGAQPRAVRAPARVAKSRVRVPSPALWTHRSFPFRKCALRGFEFSLPLAGHNSQQVEAIFYALRCVG